MEYHSAIKVLSSHTCYNLDEVYRHYATLKKPDMKGQILNGSTYIKCPEEANS